MRPSRVSSNVHDVQQLARGALVSVCTQVCGEYHDSCGEIMLTNMQARSDVASSS